MVSERKCGHNLRIGIHISPPGSKVGDTASKLTLKDIVSRRVYVTARWPSVVFMQCCDECQSGLSDPHHVAMLDARVSTRFTLGFCLQISTSKF